MNDVITIESTERVQLTSGDVIWMRKREVGQHERWRLFWRRFWGLTTEEPVDIVVIEKALK